ncbi:MAG: cytochrome b/b6 domain-containing protein [Steroidobacteraceae bacterium]
MATDFPLRDAELAARANAPTGTGSAHVKRHAGVDRLFHWLTALSMFVLLGTSLLPVVGIRFAWVEIHWIAGLALCALLLFHIVRSLLVQSQRLIWPRPSDLGELSGKRPGKYSIAQKLMHLAVSVSLVTAAVTGVLLMIKAGTPLFERDPYRFTLQTWGVLTVLHDAAAYLSLFLIMLHVYFSLRPEKRMYLRSMIKGWVTREELRRHHDPERVARDE